MIEEYKESILKLWNMHQYVKPEFNCTLCKTMVNPPTCKGCPIYYHPFTFDDMGNQVTNKELQELLKQYPDDAVVAIEYCDIRELKYIKERNLIVID